MSISRKSAQRQLDIAAEELEQAGWADLAEKVDYYNNRLAAADNGEIAIIARALSRIQIEANKRMKNAARKEDKPEKEKKAHAATMKARRASENRKEALRKKLREIAARRKRTANRLEKLRAARQARLKKT